MISFYNFYFRDINNFKAIEKFTKFFYSNLINEFFRLLFINYRLNFFNFLIKFLLLNYLYKKTKLRMLIEYILNFVEFFLE